MPLYVFALTDTPLGPRTVDGRRLRSIALDGIHVIYEQRTAAPPLTDDELRVQHALVMLAAREVRAILPARFGSLVSKRDLTMLIGRHETDIRAALDDVRDRVQMTVRVLGSTPRRPVAERPPSTGREYLERARRAATPTVPLQARRLLSALQPFVVRERREPGAGRLLATVYHLVDAAQVGQYLEATEQRGAGVVVSGPWPPFAFSPQLW